MKNLESKEKDITALLELELNKKSNKKISINEISFSRNEGWDQGRQHPMDRGAKRLPGGPQAVRKDFGDKNPDHSPLADGMGCNKQEEEDGNINTLPS